MQSSWALGSVVALLGAALSSTACDHRSSSGARAARAVPEGAFALVADIPLPSRWIASADPATAEDLVRASLFAAELRVRSPHVARVVERGEHARALLSDIARGAMERGGEITAAEAEASAAELWFELERPAAVRTGRISIFVEPLEDDAVAEAVMLRIAERVRSAENLDEFVQLAESVPRHGLALDIAAEPPVAVDGRVVPASPADEGKTALDVEYGKAAHALREVGQKSGIVRTATGFHVLVAMDFYPAFQAPKSVRHARIEKHVAETRSRLEKEALVERLRAASPPVHHPHHRELTRLALRKR